MAYDEALAQRIRDLLDGQEGITEMRMFGGLAFLVHGHMAIAASGQGGALVRYDPAAETPAGSEPMVMRGRPMDGWIRVDASLCKTKSQLERWVEMGTGYARSLPPKAPSKTNTKAKR